MEIKEWIMIISAIIVVTGWFINSYLNRRHEISKKRLTYRLETLHSFIPVFYHFHHQKNLLLMMKS
ncbi:MAG TPA: hypothetical protein EYG93_06305 [Sulfurospirillum arcachonense]|nr:hypothetical protein [Sulfurospirillum arcachonense]